MQTNSLLRTHPLTIVAYLYRFLYLLILPLARGFISALRGGFIAWLSGAWFDLLVVLFIIALSVGKWWYLQYYMDYNGVHSTSGIIFKRSLFIPMAHICTLSIQRAFWLRPLRVVKLRVDTLARDPKKADLQLYLREDDAARLMALRREPTLTQNGIDCEYRPPMRSVIFLSLLTSNSFIGIIFISTFISQAGQILGRELSEWLVSTFEEISRQIAFGLPPIAAGMAVVLLFGWLVGFGYNLLQTKNLRTRRTASTLRVEGGVIVEKAYSVQLRDISFVDVRQSLFTRLLRLYSVFVNAIGFGKEQSDIAAIVPFSAKKHTMRVLELLLPEYVISERTLKPNAGAIFKFIIEPLWACVLVPAAAIVLPWFLPGWTNAIRFCGFMLCFPAYWFLGVRLIDFFSSGLARTGEYFTLRYSEWFYLHTVVFSFDKIALINIRQSILQRGDGKCDLVVSSRAEGRSKHHLRNLDWDACAALFEAE